MDLDLVGLPVFSSLDFTKSEECIFKSVFQALVNVYPVQHTSSPMKEDLLCKILYLDLVTYHHRSSVCCMGNRPGIKGV